MLMIHYSKQNFNMILMLEAKQMFLKSFYGNATKIFSW